MQRIVVFQGASDAAAQLDESFLQKAITRIDYLLICGEIALRKIQS